MKKGMVFLCSLLAFGPASAQVTADSIGTDEVKQTMHTLASAAMRGRGNYTTDLFDAASFISERFKRAGLKYFAGNTQFFQPFGIRDTAVFTGGNQFYNTTEGLLNVVGVLPGKLKAGEVIVFFAHYDHIGYGKGMLFPGANDNASGTTALLLLADYFAKRNDNERTLIFCAFAGEELGLLGSSAFVQTLQPDSVVAVINIEMIGYRTVGRQSAFITGAKYSNFAQLFQQGLPKDFRIVPDPAPAANLFQRSDNYPFALRGIPAHTIMASTDDDPCYHQDCDVAERTDFNNMTKIIRAIALGCEGFVDGTLRPSRVKPWLIQLP